MLKVLSRNGASEVLCTPQSVVMSHHERHDAFGKTQAQSPQLSFRLFQRKTCTIQQALTQVFQRICLAATAVNEEHCHGGRCLQTRVCHQINDRVVPFVTDAGQNRQRKLCHIRGKFVTIKTGQITGCATASDDDHHVPSICLSGNRIKRTDNAFLHPLPLHDGGKKFGSEAEGRMGKLVEEVFVARCGRTRDDGDATEKTGQEQAFVQFHHPIRFQSSDDFAAAPRDIPQRVRGVNVHDLQLIAKTHVELNLDLCQQFHSRCEVCAGLTDETGTQERIGERHDERRGTSARCLTAFLLLHQSQIAKTVCVGTHLAHFRQHPEGSAEGVTKDVAHHSVQVFKRQKLQRLGTFCEVRCKRVCHENKEFYF